MPAEQIKLSAEHIRSLAQQTGNTQKTKWNSISPLEMRAYVGINFTILLMLCLALLSTHYLGSHYTSLFEREPAFADVDAVVA